ncbi:MAG: hypothetical protein ACKVYV_13370 [Limisphaerales bacterium]
MSAAELNRLLESRPFKPFTVFLPQGTGFEKPHPEFARPTPAGRALIAGRADQDGENLLDEPLITQVKVLPSPS